MGLSSPLLPPLERLPTTTVLGIRFWDPVTDSQIRDGLRVEAWPVPGMRPVVRGARTLSDLWALHGLPGLVAVEHAAKPDFAGSSPSSPPASPPSGSGPSVRRPFVVRVLDQRRRFLPTAFRVELPLPYEGIFLAASLTSPVSETPKGFLLFSGADRGSVAGYLEVRGELRDATTARPVAHAVVRVDPPGGVASRFGASDAQGRFVVHVPRPWPLGGIGGSGAGSPPGQSPIVGAPAGSPQGSGPHGGSAVGPPLDQRSFPFVLSLFHRPGGLANDPAARLPGTDLPDLGHILEQPPIGIYAQAPDDGGSPAPTLHGHLAWNRGEVVRTADRSELFVESSESPPP